MSELTKLYLIIKSFIDKNGNTFQARNEPYQYGELPIEIRDNSAFCVPYEETIVQTEVLTPEIEKHINERPEEKPIFHKTKQIKNTYIKKEPTNQEG